MQLDGKTAIVTGGARGIGRAICERYAAEGAFVVVADLLGADAEATAAAMTAAGGGALAVELDVTDQASIDAMVEAVVQYAGSIDILVNGAGIFDMAPILEITPESYEQVFAVNVKGRCSPCRRQRGGWSRKTAAARSSTSPRRPAGTVRRWLRSIARARPR